MSLHRSDSMANSKCLHLVGLIYVLCSSSCRNHKQKVEKLSSTGV